MSGKNLNMFFGTIPKEFVTFNLRTVGQTLNIGRDILERSFLVRLSSFFWIEERFTVLKYDFYFKNKWKQHATTSMNDL